MAQFWRATANRSTDAAAAAATASFINGNRVGGLDVGTSFVGVAVSDDYQMNAVPLCILRRTSRNGPLIDADAAKLVQICHAHNLKGFVVGCNFLHGANAEGDAIRDEMLASFFDTIDAEAAAAFRCVLLWDESFSSAIAVEQHDAYFREAVQSRNRFGKKYKFTSRLAKHRFIDDKAAAVILNEYLGCAMKTFCAGSVCG